MVILLGRVFLVVGFFFLFNTLTLSCHHATPLWPAKFLLKNQLIVLWGSSWYVTSSFSLATLKILSLSLISGILIIVSLCGTPWVHLNWGSLASLIWICVSFPRLGSFSAIISSNKCGFFFFFFAPSSLFFFWGPYNVNVCSLGVIQEIP